MSDRDELIHTIAGMTANRTKDRHAYRRQLPKRSIPDIAERVIKRQEKMERRAAAARKAGLL